MMKASTIIWVALLSVSINAQSQPMGSEALFSLPQNTHPTISLNGDYATYFYEDGPHSALMVVDLQTFQITGQYPLPYFFPTSVGWLDESTFFISSVTKRQTRHRIGQLQNGKIQLQPFGLYGEIISTLPGDPGHVLVVNSRSEGSENFEVLKIPLNDLLKGKYRSRNRIELPNAEYTPTFYSPFTDHLYTYFRKENSNVLHVYRSSLHAIRWKSVAQIENVPPGFKPIMVFDADTWIVQMEGGNGAAVTIKKYHPNTHAFIDLPIGVHPSPTFNMSFSQDAKPSTISDSVHHGRRQHYLLPADESLISRAAKSFGDNFAAFVAASNDQNVTLTYVSGPSEPGAFFVFDRPRDKLIRLTRQNRRLDNTKIIAPERVQFETNHVAYSGFIYTPSAEYDNQSLLIWPVTESSLHALSRRFNPLAQYLSSRGFTVLQVGVRPPEHDQLIASSTAQQRYRTTRDSSEFNSFLSQLADQRGLTKTCVLAQQDSELLRSLITSDDDLFDSCLIARIKTLNAQELESKKSGDVLSFSLPDPLTPEAFWSTNTTDIFGEHPIDNILLLSHSPPTSEKLDTWFGQKSLRPDAPSMLGPAVVFLPLSESKPALTPTLSPVDAALQFEFLVHALQLHDWLNEVFDETSNSPIANDYARLTDLLNENQSYVDPTTRQRILGRMASTGSTDALFMNARMYETGIQKPLNITKAISLYEKAALSGDSRSLIQLSEIYLRGKGTDKDLDRARQLAATAFQLEPDHESVYNLIRVMCSHASTDKGFGLCMEMISHDDFIFVRRILGSVRPNPGYAKYLASILFDNGLKQSYREQFLDRVLDQLDIDKPELSISDLKAGVLVIDESEDIDNYDRYQIAQPANMPPASDQELFLGAKFNVDVRGLDYKHNSTALAIRFIRVDRSGMEHIEHEELIVESPDQYWAVLLDYDQQLLDHKLKLEAIDIYGNLLIDKVLFDHTGSD